MDTILRTENLSIFDNIKYPEIKIKKNITTFLVGDSGCGKSTLLKLFNQTLNQNNGKIFYDNKNIEEYNTIDLRKEIMLVSQTSFLFDMTIRDNFIEFYKYREQQSPTDDEIRMYLDLCCADFDLDNTCETLSGGERQRVFAAINVSLKPSVLMLDEPTSALDELNAENVIANLKKFCKSNDITLIIISHDKRIAETYADEIITIRKDK